MFDYERYDHTYCRPPNKASEEGVHSKRRLSSVSCEGALDGDGHEQHATPQPVIERENVPSVAHEPVIIVRTKKARKTAPIIVKAMNKEGGAVLVSTVKTNTNSIISKKIVSPVVQNVTAEIVDLKQKDAKVETQADIPTVALTTVSPLTVEEKSMEDDVAEKVPPKTTKSGRTRKLTEKAKQNSEESKKIVKPRKGIKSSADNNSNEKSKSEAKDATSKKARGRPKKTVNVNGQDAASSTKEELGKDAKVDKPDPLPAADAAQESKQPDTPVSEKKHKKAISSEKKSVTENKNKRKSPSTVEEPAKKSARIQKSLPISTQKKLPKAKVKSNQKSNLKRKLSPKASGRSKLVVVTKPPPKRRAQIEAEAKTTKGSPAIPAAKIDSSNIVVGSRRRR